MLSASCILASESSATKRLMDSSAVCIAVYAFAFGLRHVSYVEGMWGRHDTLNAIDPLNANGFPAFMNINLPPLSMTRSSLLSNLAHLIVMLAPISRGKGLNPTPVPCVRCQRVVSFLFVLQSPSIVLKQKNWHLPSYVCQCVCAV